MAYYIIDILAGQPAIVWSWGFNSPIVIKDGLRFKVQGFKFRGTVEVKFNEGSDLFDVYLIKVGKVLKKIEGVYFDTLVEVIDDNVEKVDNYDERVKSEYSL